jgi:hypothetical protein
MPFLKPSDVEEYFLGLCEILPCNNSGIVQFSDYIIDNYISEEALFLPHIWPSASNVSYRTTNACCSRCVEGPKLIVVLGNTNNLLNDLKYKEVSIETSLVSSLVSFFLLRVDFCFWRSPPLRQRGCSKSGWTKFQHMRIISCEI